MIALKGQEKIARVSAKRATPGMRSFLNRTLKGSQPKLLAPLQGAHLNHTHPGVARFALTPGYYLLPFQGNLRPYRI